MYKLLIYNKDTVVKNLLQYEENGLETFYLSG